MTQAQFEHSQLGQQTSGSDLGGHAEDTLNEPPAQRHTTPQKQMQAPS